MTAISSKDYISDSDHFFQDGRIDYAEFVAMMRTGDTAGVSRSRTMRNNLNFNIADAFGVKDPAEDATN